MEDGSSVAGAAPHGLRPVWVGLASIVLVGMDLGRRILGNNDEARFAALGQSVLERGEWLFPRIGEDVYFNKPLLLAWLIGLVSWPAGRVTQFTAVLPSAAAAVLTAFAVYGFGRSLFGARAATFGALVVLAMQGVFVHARLPLPDMLMTALVTLSIWMLWELVRDGRDGPAGARGRERIGPWLGFYGLAGAAFWAKGPAGLLLPLLVAAAYAIAGGRDAWRRLGLGPGLVLIALLVAPWWLIGLSANAAAIQHVVVVDQALWYLPRGLTLRGLTAPFDHLNGVLFPWLIALPAALVAASVALRERQGDREAVRFALLAATVVFAVLALAHMQRFRYYVPMAPLCSLLIGWWASRTVSPWWDRVFARVYGALAVVALALSVVLGVFLPRWPAGMQVPLSLTQAAVLGVGFTGIAFVLALGLWRSDLSRLFGVAWLLSALSVMAGYHWWLADYNRANDYPRVRDRLERAAPGTTVVATWGIFAIPFAFYYDRPVTPVDTIHRLERAIGRDPRHVAALNSDALARVQAIRPLRILLTDRVAGVDVALVALPPATPTRP